MTVGEDAWLEAAYEERCEEGVGGQSWLGEDWWDEDDDDDELIPASYYESADRKHGYR